MEVNVRFNLGTSRPERPALQERNTCTHTYVHTQIKRDSQTCTHVQHTLHLQTWTHLFLYLRGLIWLLVGLGALPNTVARCQFGLSIKLDFMLGKFQYSKLLHTKLYGLTNMRTHTHMCIGRHRRTHHTIQPQSARTHIHRHLHACTHTRKHTWAYLYSTHVRLM
jgi:hypothetical protein